MRLGFAFAVLAGTFLFAHAVPQDARAASAFAPRGNATLSVTSTSASIPLPNNAPTLLVSNVGKSEAFIALGGGSVAADATAATPYSTSIPSGQSLALARGDATYLAAVTAAGVTALRIAQGDGTAMVAGGAAAGGPAAIGDTAIANGGAAQSLFSGAVPANGFAVYNPDPSEDLWVSDSTTAAPNGEGSIRIVADGGGYETPPDYRPVGAVSIYGATTGHKITARAW